MLYQEGWGVRDDQALADLLRRPEPRPRADLCARRGSLGFQGFSPYALPNVIAVAEGIPFIELTDWDHERLYALKGEIVRRGVEAVTGLTMPVFEKRRFQHGAVDEAGFESVFPPSEMAYRRAFSALFGG